MKSSTGPAATSPAVSLAVSRSSTTATASTAGCGVGLRYLEIDSPGITIGVYPGGGPKSERERVSPRGPERLSPALRSANPIAAPDDVLPAFPSRARLLRQAVLLPGRLRTSVLCAQDARRDHCADLPGDGGPASGGRLPRNSGRRQEKPSFRRPRLRHPPRRARRLQRQPGIRLLRRLGARQSRSALQRFAAAG